MKGNLETAAGNYNLYHARRSDFATDQKIPFKVSPTPFELTSDQRKNIATIGRDVTALFRTVDELYNSDGTVRQILDTGKPQIFLGNQSQYLFARPDIIITPEGFSICEIETSPFGLALAEILNRSYSASGFETMVADGTLASHVQAHTPTDGTIIYSNKTGAYAGQISFLAEQIFSTPARNWQAKPVEGRQDIPGNSNIYRAFYLSEYLKDPNIAALLNQNPELNFLPSLTPHLEEKAVLALFYDSRFQEYFRKRLGDAAFKHLKELIPATWIVGQEEFFAPGLPNNMTDSVGLANLSKSKRAFVLKSSGFSEDASWKEGVHLLHKTSAAAAQQLLQAAASDKTRLHIVQEFKQPIKIPLTYESDAGEDQLQTMQAKVRLTPYYSLTGDGSEGSLIAIKATGRENTDFIHASSDSINTAVR